MDHWSRYAPTSVAHLLAPSAFSRLRVLIFLFTLAIQLAIPVAQIWHVAVAHTSAVTFSEQRHSDQPATHRMHLESHLGDEFDDPLYCLVCQAFVSMHEVGDIQAQVATDIERSTDQLPLTRCFVCQICLHSSTPRAPPAFS